MDPLLDFLRKATEYGLNPWLVAALAAVWLAWRFPAVRAFLTRPVTDWGNGKATRYVTAAACHDAMDRLAQHVTDKEEETRREMREGFRDLSLRIDNIHDRGPR
jgi:hypothetical protein